MIRPGIRRLFRLWVRRAGLASREVDEEIQFHIDQRAAQLVREGLSRERAHAEALRRFGIPQGARRKLHDSATQREGTMRIRERWHEAVLDLRLAARGLRRDAFFTTFVVTTLALGIGANAIMYGVLDRLLLRGPSHVAAPEDIGNIVMTTRPPDAPERVRSVFAYVLYDNLRTRATTFDEMAAYAAADPVVGRGEDARQARARYVSASFFPLLGTQPVLGRFFTSAEDTTTGAERVVVLGYALWQTRFGGLASALGQDLIVDGQMHTIIGVTPRGFTGVGLSRVDLWLPISLRGPVIRDDWATTWNSAWISAIARVKPGVTREQAARDATATHRATYDGQSPVTGEGDIRVAPLGVDMSGRISAEATVSRWLVGVAAIVLVIACLNVTNLLLARVTGRRRDMAVRIALGSGSWRVTRAVLAESTLLALAGCAAGMLVAHGGGVLVRTVLLPQVDWSNPVVSPRVLALSVVIALVVAVGVGLGPAWHTLRANVIASLKTGDRESGGRRARLRAALTVVQAAFSVVLLVGAALFVTSLWRVRALDLGIEPDRMVTIWLHWREEGSDPFPARIRDAEDRRQAMAEQSRRNAVLRAAVERLRELPDVEHASIAVGMPFVTSFGGILVRVPGRDTLPTMPAGPYIAAVGDQYFATTGTRIVRGRPFGLADGAGSERVMILNEAMAAAIWPGEDPVGRCLTLFSDTLPCARVVGVAANTRRFRLREDPITQFYVPYGQELNIGGTVLVARPRGNAADVVETIRRQLLLLDPGIVYADITPLSERLDPQYRPWRLGASVFVMCGALALIVAAVGLYSVLTYLVAQRRQEIGVRVALGARAADVTMLILRSGLRIVTIGIAAGLIVALAAGRFIQDQLFETSAKDPVIFAAVSGSMLVVAFAACLLPAAAARRINPVSALRAE